MKVIVLLVCLAAFVAAKDRIIQKDGKECVCRSKTCDDDISCEEHHCLCILKNLRALENDKSNKYPKSWVLAYRKLVEKRCRCLKKCEKRCSDDDIEQCSERTWDRFTCGFGEVAADILSKCSKGQAERMFEDIGKTNAICIRKDCKPQCIGDADCDPLLRVTDINCIKKATEQTKSELADHECRDHIGSLGHVLLQHANGLAACHKAHSCAIARTSCVNSQNSKSAVAIAGVKSSCYTTLGHCTASSAWYSFVTKITICVIRAEK